MWFNRKVRPSLTLLLDIATPFCDTSSKVDTEPDARQLQQRALVGALTIMCQKHN